MGDGKKQPKPVKNFTGQMHSIEASSSNSGEANEGFLTEANRRGLLHNIIGGISESVVEKMSKYLERIKSDIVALDSGNESCEIFYSLVTILDSLMQHTDSIDNANDFHKIGGFDVLHRLLVVSHPGVRAKTAELIADLVQNNPYCQNKIVQTGILPLLLQMVDSDPDETVNIKALYAVSCITRQNPRALNYLIESDGLSVLLRAIQKPVEKLRIKSAFLLTHLCYQQSEILEMLHKMGLAQQLCTLLQLEYEASHEYLLSALLALVLQHESSRNECAEPRWRLKLMLERNMEFFEGKEEYREVNEYCMQICSLCFNNDSFNTLE